MSKRFNKSNINLMYDVVNGLDSIIDAKVDYNADGEIDCNKLTKSEFPKLLRIRLFRALNAYENAIYTLEDIKDNLEMLIDKAEGRI